MHIKITYNYIFRCTSCSVTSFSKLIKIMQGQAPFGDPTDHIYKWIALTCLILFLIIKLPVFRLVAKKLVKSIDDLEYPYFWRFYPPLALLTLVTAITSIKLIEIYTEEYYASRLVFISSGAAVGVLLGVCGISVLSVALLNKKKDSMSDSLIIKPKSLKDENC